MNCLLRLHTTSICSYTNCAKKGLATTDTKASKKPKYIYICSDKQRVWNCGWIGTHWCVGCLTLLFFIVIERSISSKCRGMPSNICGRIISTQRLHGVGFFPGACVTNSTFNLLAEWSLAVKYAFKMGLDVI